MSQQPEAEITLELGDIQGVITQGYGKFPNSRYLLLEIKDVDATKKWLSSIADTIVDSEWKELGDYAANVSFTFLGLKKLGLNQETCDLFSREFKEGIATDHRQRLLGDRGKSSPEHWKWGGNNGEKHFNKNPIIHIIWTLFGLNEEHINKLYEEHAKEIEAGGMIIHNKLDGLTLKDRKEHFGFRDGISQPIIKGSGMKEAEHNTVNAGEFLFGYINGYEEIPLSPTMPKELDPKDILPSLDSKNPGGPKDFGKNGTYMVYRQLSQDVVGFWEYMDQQADGDEEKRIRLASKMVGRWPSGAPLAKYPDKDPMKAPDSKVSNDDDFGYAAEDAMGDKCPFGSHLRRNNPRDAMPNTSDAKTSRDIVNRHRMIRRGRAYGKPIVDTMHSSDILKSPAAGQDMGLHFVCFNTNIARQFEFVQHTWVNDPKFHGLYNDPDPVMGEPDPELKGKKASFTIQQAPVREEVRDIPRFVEVIGGEYFFTPGIRAIKYLASL